MRFGRRSHYIDQKQWIQNACLTVGKQWIAAMHICYPMRENALAYLPSSGDPPGKVKAVGIVYVEIGSPGEKAAGIAQPCEYQQREGPTVAAQSVTFEPLSQP